MWKLLVLLAFAVGVIAPDPDPYQLVWHDEFNFFDHNKWQHEITAWGGGNYEFQAYTNLQQNVYTDNGKLFLKPTLTSDRYGFDFLQNGAMNMFPYGFCSNDNNWGCHRDTADIPPIMSGRIRSAQRFNFKYGKIVVDAKMPKGDWLWPAIWLLPEYNVYGEWPRSGEIDLVEIISNEDLVHNLTGEHIGMQRMGATLHWGPYWNVNKWWLTHGVRDKPFMNFGEHFHEYEMEWNERQMIFRVSGQHVLSVPSDEQLEQGFTSMWDWGEKNGGWGGHENPWSEGTPLAPFDQCFHIIMNVAVGGLNGFIPDDVINAGGQRPKPWHNSWSQRQAYQAFWDDRVNWYPTWNEDDAAMQVRSVRVYKKVETGQPEADAGLFACTKPDLGLPFDAADAPKPPLKSGYYPQAKPQKADKKEVKTNAKPVLKDILTKRKPKA